VEVKPQVRQYVVKALGEIGDPSAIPILQVISASNSEMYYTQISAQKALKKLQRLR
jgi:HEAT repeat protein